MDKSEIDSTAKIVGALLLGVAAGAVLGILFAPDKGSETRRKLFSGIKDFSDEFQQAFEDPESERPV